MTFRHECQKSDTMPSKKTIIALVYDFDKTLSTSEMQNPFIKRLGYEPDAFWEMSNEFAKKNNMDKNLAYLHCLKKECSNKGVPVNREVFKAVGKEIEFYPGVLEWFDAIDRLAKELNVTVEHYIVSSGMKEILDGTPIAKYFKKIYACEYQYDENKVPVWVKNVVNYTSKTQFIFRINKGALEIWEDDKVNEFVYHDERRIPFENMIYFGDGSTDIPCMKIVKEYGGHSIGVYSDKDDAVRKMMYDGRIDFFCKADYSVGGELYEHVATVMKMMALRYPLMMDTKKQFKAAEKSINKQKPKKK